MNRFLVIILMSVLFVSHAPSASAIDSFERALLEYCKIHLVDALGRELDFDKNKHDVADGLELLSKTVVYVGEIPTIFSKTIIKHYKSNYLYIKGEFFLAKNSDSAWAIEFDPVEVNETEGLPFEKTIAFIEILFQKEGERDYTDQEIKELLLRIMEIRRMASFLKGWFPGSADHMDRLGFDEEMRSTIPYGLLHRPEITRNGSEIDFSFNYVAADSDSAYDKVYLMEIGLRVLGKSVKVTNNTILATTRQ